MLSTNLDSLGRPLTRTLNRFLQNPLSTFELNLPSELHEFEVIQIQYSRLLGIYKRPFSRKTGVRKLHAWLYPKLFGFPRSRALYPVKKIRNMHVLLRYPICFMIYNVRSKSSRNGKDTKVVTNWDETLLPSRNSCNLLVEFCILNVCNISFIRLDDSTVGIEHFAQIYISFAITMPSISLYTGSI